MNIKTQKNPLIEFKERIDYLSPTVNSEVIEIEHAISASSATIPPTDVNNQVQEEWTEQDTESHDLPW